ncbi:hypothetical protein QBC44DRAFT_361605 [Cladorrhinum sp. PSN332]|nr:hypothetical protein QBC44DRAFT_361605 [Cladorrhinum sp. PSN332]
MAVNASNRAVAAGNVRVYTPKIIAKLPRLAPANAQKVNLASLAPLNAADCPRFVLNAADYPELPALIAKSKAGLAYPPTVPAANQKWYGTMIRVVNMDSFDCALQLPTAIFGLGVDDKKAEQLQRKVVRRLKQKCRRPNKLQALAGRVAVLNLANAGTPGGGWERGATAQEECLCFRSTLGASLRAGLYPWETREGLYTRDVVIYRGPLSYTPPYGHELSSQLEYSDGAERLPVVSVLSVAAIYKPRARAVGAARRARNTFANLDDRNLTKDKIRLTLRMAARNGHTALVLGALGCGVFANPPVAICECFAEVFQEPEFSGGWFKEIVFAILDPRGDGNYAIFQRHFTREAFMVSAKAP